MLRTAWQLFFTVGLPQKPTRFIGIGIGDWARGALGTPTSSINPETQWLDSGG